MASLPHRSSQSSQKRTHTYLKIVNEVIESLAIENIIDTSSALVSHKWATGVDNIGEFERVTSILYIFGPKLKILDVSFEIAYDGFIVP